MLTALLLAAAQTPPPQPNSIEIRIEGLRNAHGMLLACLTRAPAHFPQCDQDPAARKLRIAASATEVRFDALPPGEYALSIVHDENANGRLDMMIGIPREGFGFSRNPGLRFGPPRFDSVVFPVRSGAVHQTVRMRYLF